MDALLGKGFTLGLKTKDIKKKNDLVPGGKYIQKSNTPEGAQRAGKKGFLPAISKSFQN